jgi:hypothetical protein
MKSNKFILDCIKYRDFTNMISFISKFYNRQFDIFKDKDFYFTICNYNNHHFIHIDKNNLLDIINNTQFDLIKKNLSSFSLENCNYFTVSDNIHKLFSKQSFYSLVHIKLNNCYNLHNFIQSIFIPNNKFFYLHTINLKNSNVNIDDIENIIYHFSHYKGFFRFSIDFEDDSFSIVIIVSNPNINITYKSKFKILVMDTFGYFNLQHLIIKTHFEK